MADQQEAVARGADTLGIVLVASDHARVHAAFLMAAGAAALGRTVILFATGPGVRALCADTACAAADAALRAQGVAGVADLRDAARELGVRLIACESGLRAEAVPPGSLLDGVSTAGLASFLEATRQAQMLSF